MLQIIIRQDFKKITVYNHYYYYIEKYLKTKLTTGLNTVPSVHKAQ